MTGTAEIAAELPAGTVVGPRFGVEEEFLVVDPETREAVPQAEAVLRRARPELGDLVGGEITTLQVETKTAPCDNVADLHRQLVRGRAVIGAAAAAEGLRVVASGSAVLGDVVPPPIVSGERPARGTATFRGLHDEVAICSVHVHVEMPDRDRAALVSNHLRPYLPVLIGLTANSPYWAGRDTGYASWRTIAWHRWPVAGPPPYFTSAEHYDRTVDTLLDAGALVDLGTLFWDIRLSAHLPTLEIRVADVPITAEESALFAALVRALVVRVGVEVDRGEPGPGVPAELLRVAYWRAARDGLAGHGVDPLTGELWPAVELVDRLHRYVAPVLARNGDLPSVTSWLDRLLGSAADGAVRQRRAAARRDRLTDVVDDLVAQTVPELVEVD
ncbi:glutamate--cysteine ligase [Micromonospora sp. NBC_01699]|uniref:carboxylate-amine ligase n=1 Tax=Micromonospora sp. NBC_01699 TaxID=2975984 RepID=UPI002E2CF662|nr:glutamate--cysteine ligase [Micromonospora sp. NBC_01699]